jgi:uncharacterized membrane protein YkoI
MRMPGSVITTVAAFGLAGLGVTSALAGVHERSEMRALEKASVPMNDAASAVEQQTGGVVLSIVFMDDNGTPTYDVESMNNGALTETKVNAMTGQMTPVGTKQQSELTADEKAEAAAGKQPMSLQQATTAAEQQAHGKAIQSELTTTGGQPVYAIDIVAGDQVSEVVVDPVTGTIVIK